MDRISAAKFKLLVNLKRINFMEKLCELPSTELRIALFSAEILTYKDHQCLSNESERAGDEAQANLLLDLIVTKSDDEISRFLDMMQAKYPSIHATIMDTAPVADIEEIGSHIRQVYEGRNCHLVQVLPGESFELNLTKQQYNMPMLFTTEKLKHDRTERDWLPTEKVKRIYEVVQFDTIENIIHSLPGSDSHLLLCTGIAGVGKTICTSRLICSWVKQEQCLEKFELVIAVPLRQISVDSSLVNMISTDKNGLGLVTEELKSSLEFCLQDIATASKCLVIFDGVDEVDILPDSELWSIITGNKYKHVNVMLTARQEATFLTKVKHFWPDYQVSLHGTNKEGLYSYLNALIDHNEPNTQPSKVNELLSRCKEHMTPDLLLVPLYATLVGFLFHNHWVKYCSFANFEIPHNATSFFGSFTHILLRVWLQRQGRNEEADNLKFTNNPLSKSSTLANDMKCKVFQISRLSYNALVSQSNIFYESDFSQFMLDTEDILQSGFFNSSSVKGKIQGFFKHKTFLEYFAALYLSDMQLELQSFSSSIENTRKEQPYTKTISEVFPKLQPVLKFLCVLNPQLVTEVLKKLNKVVAVTNLNFDVLRLDLEAEMYIEAEDYDLKKQILEVVSNAYTSDRFYIQLQQFANISKFYEEFPIAMRKKLLDRWYSLRTYIDAGELCLSNTYHQTSILKIPSLTQSLYLLLRGCTFPNIMELELISSETYDLKLLQIIFPNLQNISIQRNALYYNSILNRNSLLDFQFDENIIKGKQLEQDTISRVAILDDIPEESLKYLKQQTNLKSLRLDVSTQQLLFTLQDTTCWKQLKKLELFMFEKGISPAGSMDNIFLFKNHTPNLTSLSLCCSKKMDLSTKFLITERISQSLRVTTLSQLKELRLFRLVDDLAKFIVIISGMRSLQIIGFETELIVGKNEKILSQLLTENDNINELHLGHSGSLTNREVIQIYRHLKAILGSQVVIGFYDYFSLNSVDYLLEDKHHQNKQKSKETVNIVKQKEKKCILM